MLTLRLLSLAGLVAASPLRSAQDYAEALRHVARQDGVTEQDVDNLAFYAEHAGASYCNTVLSAGDAIQCGGTCPNVEADGATILGTFDGAVTGIAAYLAIDNKRTEIVLSVRGSSNIRNWISNVDFNFEDSDLTTGAKVHDGFQRAWDELSDGVSAAIDSALAAHPGYRIVSTGHSLGAAVATLGGAYLRKAGHSVDIYNYGSPRVGNDVTADFISAQEGPEWRVTHSDDPVPRLPPIIFGYRHTSPEYWLSTEDASTEDYPVSDIKVCTGNANVKCNAGTFGLDIDAHREYFGAITNCTEITTTDNTRRDETDAELESRLNGWVQQDIDFVGA